MMKFGAGSSRNVRFGIGLGLGIAMITCFALTPPARAADNPKDLTDEQTSAIEQLIHTYIVAHPEILLEAQSALQEAGRVDTIRRVIAQNKDALYRNAHDMVLGNPHGDVALIEFFDYNCPYCKRIDPDLQRRIAADGKIKIILKSMPYLTKDSAAVSYLASAASRQGKFVEFHHALLESKGETTEASALRVAEKLGLDIARLKRDAAEPEVRAITDRSTALSKALNIQGTPFFFIDEKYIAGVPDDFDQQLDRMTADVRKAGCKLC